MLKKKSYKFNIKLRAKKGKQIRSRVAILKKLNDLRKTYEYIHDENPPNYQTIQLRDKILDSTFFVIQGYVDWEKTKKDLKSQIKILEWILRKENIDVEFVDKSYHINDKGRWKTDIGIS